MAKKSELWKYVLEVLHALIAIGLILELGKLFFSEKASATVVTLGTAMSLALLLAIGYGFRNDHVLSNRIHKKDESIDELNKEISDLQSSSEKKIKELENYVRLFPILNKAFLDLRGCYRDTFDDEKKKRGFNFKQNYESSFKDFCTTLSTGFTTLKGTYCHVALKYLLYVNEENEFRVFTLARDTHSFNKNRGEIDREKYKHPVSENSDYKQIFFNSEANLGRYYFNNDIVSDITYENTSLLKYYKTNAYPKNLRKEKTIIWELPYKSTITAGISDRLQVGTLVGYLCIDADEVGVFNERLDSEILAGCADDLYDSLKTYITDYVIAKK